MTERKLHNGNTFSDEMIAAIENEYTHLTLANDFMFGTIMSKTENCIEMLRILTGDDIKSIETLVSQKAIKITNDSKGSRYDIYVISDTGTIYDAELQNKHGMYTPDVLAKRARFYQGLIDLNT